MLTTTNPTTGITQDTDIELTSAAETAALAASAQAAFETLRTSSREWRAGLLEALADGLEERRTELVAVADAETGLGEGRLNGELGRSQFQFRLFAEALREGSYLEATIDYAGDTPLGHGPELRRMLIPIGPVAVFGSSNFPFAFSVVGGDTASALAAGNSVVIKAHSSHPLTSRLSFRTLADAATRYGAPDGTISIIFGTQSGRDLVADPHIAAVGFTGSLGAGEALMEIIATRETPIPFYGELSSLNPLVITEAAAEERGAAIAEGLFGSFTLGAGQFCTKPGVALLPSGPSGDAILDGLRERTTAAGGLVLLNSRISSSLTDILGRITGGGSARIIAAGTNGDAGIRATPTLLEISADDFTAATAEEAFGPVLVVVRYTSLEQVSRAIDVMPGSLTATIHHGHDEPQVVQELSDKIAPTVGRLVFNGFPTGVRVSWAQHHGGNWPSTNSQHSSVGVSAIRRFLRPIAFQDAPEAVLPEELRENYTAIPRRIDGVLVLASDRTRSLGHTGSGEQNAIV
ncbi:aldehyde dehydrogenase (NADP(+)) [Salinibacterium sp. NK8237]|uniref:aldehyde dehydrogenase (NADP(+)) n=1 Tax=Salinibacterium sp. NK8237 TaxID=2792038 RepID=UPI0018CD9132|nr:aldehyde dehydrogenase (NADP(+)) [Salinibacterium sp. NK8237]MBH0129546.1 aldehyde dehydrogenase (NADP(+)) [Salinibacterium sp. NK8237]